MKNPSIGVLAEAEHRGRSAEDLCRVYIDAWLSAGEPVR